MNQQDLACFPSDNFLCILISVPRMRTELIEKKKKDFCYLQKYSIFVKAMSMHFLRTVSLLLLMGITICTSETNMLKTIMQYFYHII